MIVCGVDINSKDACLALVAIDDQKNLSNIKCTTKKISLADDSNSVSLLNMLKAIKAFAEEHSIDKFAIKTRLGKGAMASSGVTFKIEALFQIAGTPVEFITPQALGKFKKTNQAGIPAGLLKYQTEAYLTAALNLVK